MLNSYRIEGKRGFGDNLVLLEAHDDLTLKTSWKETGYSVEPFLDASTSENLFSGLYHFVFEALNKEGVQLPENFSLDQYHYFVPNKQLHLKILEHTKAIDYSKFPIATTTLLNRISESLGEPLTTVNPNTGENIFHLRIVRPNSTDYNPLHRDAWLDELKGSINLYVPVAGSTQNSALFVVPGSHHWPESEIERTLEGAIMDGAKYNVPGLTGSKKQLQPIRPNPKKDEVLIFSPYLIHGGAFNLNQDQTRISLEIRLWRKS
jgi:hypothetical protein